MNLNRYHGVFSFLLFALVGISPMKLYGLAVGGSVGMDLPLAQGDSYDPGIAAEGYYRVDPYEIRFHFSDMNVKSYSVMAAMKHFMSDDIARPFVEAAFGPVINSTKGKGLSYGIKPEVSLGVDIGINKHLSTGAAFRYFGMAIFGKTSSGKFEANHGFSIVALLGVWF